MIVSPSHNDSAVNSTKPKSVRKRVVCGQGFSFQTYKMQIGIDRVFQIPIRMSEPAVQLQDAGDEFNQSGSTETMSGQRLCGIDQKISGFVFKHGMNRRAF